MVDNLDNGQLNVKLDTIIDQLKTLSKDMVTKDVFEVWKQGNADRIARLETDVAKWINESTATHVRLEADSKARHAETESEIESLRVSMENKLQAAATRQDGIDEGIKNRKNSMAGVWVAVAIGGALTLAGLVIQLVTALR